MPNRCSNPAHCRLAVINSGLLCFDQLNELCFSILVLHTLFGNFGRKKEEDIWLLVTVAWLLLGISQKSSHPHNTGNFIHRRIINNIESFTRYIRIIIVNSGFNQ